MTDQAVILLFIKAPEQDRVKSRLARDLGGWFVLGLYECMVLDTIDALGESGVPFRICYTPPGSLERMQVWLGHDRTYQAQAPGDIGERMQRAFAGVFSEGVRRAVLIGSDIPGLNAALISEACRALEEKDAVIGPADDGGYYLIGFRNGSFPPAAFHGIPWSTETVFRETLDRLQAASLTVHVLPECTDVDTIEDLRTLLSPNNDALRNAARTRAFLLAHRGSIDNACENAGTGNVADRIEQTKKRKA